MKANKSILVIDTPDTCLDCMFCFELDEGINACCSVMSDKMIKVYAEIFSVMVVIVKISQIGVR